MQSVVNVSIGKRTCNNCHRNYDHRTTTHQTVYTTECLECGYFDTHTMPHVNGKLTSHRNVLLKHIKNNA